MSKKSEYTQTKKLNEDWNETWSKRTIIQEIKMRDFYRGREYILKYLPRNGKIIEAGCGLGRYVFYLSDLDFDITGVDVSKSGLQECKNWSEESGYNPDMFKYVDVRKLLYPDNYFSGYVSLGVIEHFEEGPHKALKEAFRVLRGGGIAIIETPNRYSFEFIYLKILKPFKSVVKFVLTKLNLLKTKKVDKKRADEFFQYEYSVKELANFIKNADFEIIEKRTIDLKYPLYQICKSLQFVGGMRLLRLLKPYIFPILDRLERTRLSLFGGLSMVIAYKPSKNSHCFFCGDTDGYRLSKHLGDPGFLVPICQECLKKTPEKILFTYKKGKNLTTYKGSYSPDIISPSEIRVCFFCGNEYRKNIYFEDYGFSVPVCPNCLRDPIKNLELSNFYFKHVWREYDGL